MTKDELRHTLERPYNQDEWRETLRDVFGPGSYYPRPPAIALPANDLADAAYELGSFYTATDTRLVGVYEVTLKPGVRIEGKRVGLRQLLRPIYKLVDGALVVFTGDDGTWRFSYISEIHTYDAAGNRQEEKTDAKRYTYVLGKGIHARTPADRFYKLAIKRPAGLSLKDITEAFSVDSLTKDFYRELSDWYFWARDLVTFPSASLPRDPADSDAKHLEKVNATSTIRLITRLMFVWFIKQKGLVPTDLFDEGEVEKLIKGFQPKITPGLFVPAEPGDSQESTYYKAILQNLFFATLNTEMSDTERRFKENIQHREKTEFRYRRFFTNEDRFLTLIRDVPFLNGGLFDCLDSSDAKGDRIDCFSDNPKNEPLLAVPDYLFFGEPTPQNLNKAYGDVKHGKQIVRGLIPLLNRYNFTVEENTPVDVEVALDPELLGKVFENLLASFNPETETTARKQTGSFYTPREIVEYMVDESLKAHLNQCLTERHPGADYTGQLADLFNYSSTATSFTDAERQTLVNALYDCKVLDPACGSGAFPLGMLQRMVHLLFKLDAKNEYLVKKAKTVAEKEFGDVLTDIPASEQRQQRIAEIEHQFRENSDDYNRKLVLIEQCLHGVDIQPIAVQITKLRFFISLVVEQEPTTDPTTNRGIRPLPNLETKFVAANTLIGLDRQGGTIRDLRIDKLEAELDIVRHQHFRARTRKTKKKYRVKDAELRIQIADILRGSGWKVTVADQLANWNPYDQNCSADFFDNEWMFGMNRGFDVVIGNPPYVTGASLSKEEKKYFKDNYKTAQYQLDLYVLFLEKGVNLLKENGLISYITPNSWLKNMMMSECRRFVLDNLWLRTLNPNLPSVFTASVDTSIYVAQRTNKSQQIIVWTFTEDRLIEYTGTVKQEAFRSNDRFTFDVEVSGNTLPIIEAVRFNSFKHHEISDITRGVNPYDKYRGQSEDIIKNKAYHADRKLDITFVPEIRGRHLGSYYYKWDGKNHISYGPWLAAPREEKFFKGERLVMRQVLGERLICTVIKDDIIIDQSIFISKLKDAYIQSISIKFIQSLFSSKLFVYYFRHSSNEFDELFPKIKIGEFRELPIKKTEPEVQLPFIRIVDYILFLKVQPLSVDDQIIPAYFEQVIDGLVYELYFEAELHRAGCRFYEHLRQLTDVTALSSDAEKLALCRWVFTQFYDPGHPVRLSLFNLGTVPEVAIIEGMGK